MKTPTLEMSKQEAIDSGLYQQIKPADDNSYIEIGNLKGKPTMVVFEEVDGVERVSVWLRV